MLVVVEQALGDVEHDDVVVLGLFGEGEDEFVTGAALGEAAWQLMDFGRFSS